MFRLQLLALTTFLVCSCSSDETKNVDTVRSDYPRSIDSSHLPKQINVIGIIEEVRYGYCGIFCQGGYITVALDDNKINYNFRKAYIITACLSTLVKTGDHVDVIATLHTGQEEECYYKNFDAPTDKKDIIFYKLTETETQKIR